MNHALGLLHSFFEHFHFLRPLWLCAALPCAWLFYRWWRAHRPRDWSALCDAELVPYLLDNAAPSGARWPFWVAMSASVLTILALAGPSWERLPTPTYRAAHGVVIALEVSRAMHAEDLKPNRLARARFKVIDLLRRYPEGQVALVAYADEPFTVTPLTDDRETLINLLQALSPDLMPRDGHAAHRAIAHAAALLQQAGLPKGDILLIASDVSDRAPPAAALGAYRVAVWGVGTEQGAPVKNASGGFVQDAQGNVWLPRLGEAALQRLTDEHAGIYQRMQREPHDLERWLDWLRPDRLTAAAASTPTNEDTLQWRDRGPWLLWGVVPLALLLFRRGILGLVFASALSWSPDSSAQSRFENWLENWFATPDQRAERAFDAGQYDQAAMLFSDPAWRAAAHYRAGRYADALAALANPQTADDFYNRGNALARLGQWQAARDAYEAALQRDPQHQDAAYNKRLVEQALSQQTPSSAETTTAPDQANAPNDHSGSSANDSSAQHTPPQNTASPATGPAENPHAGATPPAQRPDAADTSDHNLPQQSEPSPQQTATPESAKPDANATAAAPQNTHAAEAASQAFADPADQPADTPQPSAAPPTAAQAVPGESPAHDEQRQAAAQWLQRIPDDPGGLLRRKFYYQYRQRQSARP